MSGDQAQNLTIISLLIFHLLFLNCCKGNSSKLSEIEREINLLMDIREKAIKEKNLGLYMDCISRDYNDSSKNFISIKQEMKENFSAFDKIDFFTENRALYSEGDFVMVVQDYEIVFSFEGKKEHIQGKERLFLRKENSIWKILNGL